tara:strand:+ start:292 stop:504 length:213 start_codon:yes stop_codon:yes gene_type:complete
MAEKFSTTLTWEGNVEIGRRLSALVPDDLIYKFEEDGDSSILTITVEADDLENLREIVDSLLTTFSDQDE